MKFSIGPLMFKIFEREPDVRWMECKKHLPNARQTVLGWASWWNRPTICYYNGFSFYEGEFGSGIEIYPTHWCLCEVPEKPDVKTK